MYNLFAQWLANVWGVPANFPFKMLGALFTDVTKKILLCDKEYLLCSHGKSSIAFYKCFPISYVWRDFL
jgi:hypothetical protein